MRTEHTCLSGINSSIRSMLPVAYLLLAATLCCISTANAQGPAGVWKGPVGVWKGEWRSQSTGHHGPMRANIRPNSAGGYDARFTGRFAVIIPFTYKESLTPTYDSAGNLHLHASRSLGPLLGGYSMQAQVFGDRFQGSFQASKDTGTVQMRRVR